MPKTALERQIDSGSILRGGAGVFNGGGGLPVLPEHNTLPGLTVGDPHPMYLNTARANLLYVPLARLITTAATSGLTGGGPLSGDLALALAAGVAGNGLSLSNGVLTVGTTGLGLDTTATQVRLSSSSNPGPAARILATNAAGEVQLVGAYLTAAYVGTLDMGVDTLYEDASYLHVAGSKDVLFEQIVRGSGWSMTPAGQMTAAAGNFAGDLYAAASAFRVINHTHDYPHSHVVINPSEAWTLDEQFGLDIDDNLLVRGFIVGKHALQIKDALMICHFDGPERGPNGNTTGHMGQPGTVAGNVVHRLGRFGKAIEVADAYTNLVSNPSFETDTTGWATYSNGTATGSRTRTNEEAWDGYYSYRLIKAGGANADRWGIQYTQAVTSGLSYSLTVRVKIVAAGNPTGNVVSISAAGNLTGASAGTAVDGEWTEIALTTTALGTGNASFYVWLSNCDTATVYIDAAQITQTTAVRPYWTGARLNGQLTYGNLAVNWPHCTTMAWVRTSDLATKRAANLRLFELYIDADNRVNMLISSVNDTVRSVHVKNGVSTNVVSTTVATARAWHHAAAVLDGTVLRLYWDGVQVATASVGILNAATATMYVGSFSGGERLNGMVDDLAIINRALSADEIRAVYESDAPVFAETSTWHWRAGANRFWADAEGIWMLNAAGQPMFGAYAGDELNTAATKTWGGLDLASSDLLIGDSSRGGYVRWDDSTGILDIKGAITVTGGNAATAAALATGLAGKLNLGEAADDINDNITLIHGGKIQTGTIEANRLTVGTLSSITANLGTVTAGSIVVGSANKLWLNEAEDGQLAIGGTVKGSAPFRVSAAGHLDAIDAAFGTLLIDSSGAFVDAPALFSSLNYGYKFKYGGTLAAGLFAEYAVNSAANLYLLNNRSQTSGLIAANANALIRVEGMASDLKESRVVLSSRRESGGYTDITILNTSSVRTVTFGAESLIVQPLGGGSHTVWHAGNDGAGSGLDADTVDGVQASALALLSGATFSGAVVIQNTVRFTTAFAADIDWPNIPAGQIWMYMYEGTSGRKILKVRGKGTNGGQAEFTLLTTGP